MAAHAHSLSNKRSSRFADAAEAIVLQIEAGSAVTCYMHRSHTSQALFTARGDVFPVWFSSEDGSGRWYGSQFGRPDPSLTFHITRADKHETKPTIADTPRYYVDCAGFVRELLSMVFPPAAHFDPKRDLLRRAEDNEVPEGTGFRPRNYPRAHIFFHEFEDCHAIEHCVPGQDDWGRVSSPQQLRRGDVVVQVFEHAGPHTGHVWVVIAEPDASGAYFSAESSRASGRNGVARVPRNISQIAGPNFTIGRLVEAVSPPTTAPAVYQVCAGSTQLRSGPDLESKLICELPSLARMTAVESDRMQRRVHVEASCGTTGWVTKKFLDVDEDEDVQHPQKYSGWHGVAGQPGAYAGCRVGRHGASMREHADISNSLLDIDRDNPVVMKLRAGEPLRKRAERLRVRYEDADGVKTGWVSARYVKRC